MTDLLQIDKLNFSFEKGQAVLKDISLSMREGEILVLLGASGCGKTTLLNCIAGLETPASGSIKIRETNLFENGRSIKTEQRPVGVVFQGNALFPHLNVSENIRFGLNKKSKSEQERILSDMLELIDLQAEAQRMPHELSGGQQQRVAIARSLARDPELLLMDEPFSDLDEGLKARLRTDLLNLLRQANRAAIIVTHDSRDAMALADRVAVMKDGNILQIGTPEELYHTANSDEVKRHFGPHVDLEGKVLRPEELVLSKTAGQKGTVLSCRFMGGHYLLEIETENGNLQLDSPQTEAIGNTVFFQERT